MLRESVIQSPGLGEGSPAMRRTHLPPVWLLYQGTPRQWAEELRQCTYD